MQDFVMPGMRVHVCFVQLSFVLNKVRGLL